MGQIEFNEYPDDVDYLHSHGQTPVRHVFLTAAHARGLGPSGKFWIVDPSMKHPFDFYTGKMRICPRDLFQVIDHIQRNDPLHRQFLRDDFSLSSFPFERRGTWKQPKPCYSCVPPPP